MHEVLQYWFSDASRWFDGAVDADARARFADRYAAAAAGDLDGWKDTPDGAVALAVLLERFHPDVGPSATDTAAIRSGRGGTRIPPSAGPAGIDGPVPDPLGGPGRRRPRDCRAHRRPPLPGRPVRAQAVQTDGSSPPVVASGWWIGSAGIRDATRSSAARPPTTRRRGCRLPRRRSPGVPHPRATRLRILVLHGFPSPAPASRRGCGSSSGPSRTSPSWCTSTAPTSRPPIRRTPTGGRGGGRATTTGSTTGWEESIRLVDAHLPIDGVLGFSQGAVLAGLVAALRTERLRFAICISGFPSRADAHRMLTLPGSIDLPSLHVYGEKDTWVSRERTRALADCFVGPRVVSHTGGHYFPELWPHRHPPHVPPAVPRVRASAPGARRPAVARRADPPRGRGAAPVRRLAAARRVADDAPERPRPPDSGSQPWQVLAGRGAGGPRRGHRLDGPRRPRHVRRRRRRAVDAIADRFAVRIAADEADGLSLAAEAAPRTGSATGSASAGSAVGSRRSSGRNLPPVGAYIDYRRRIVALSGPVRVARRRARLGRGIRADRRDVGRR